MNGRIEPTREPKVTIPTRAVAIDAYVLSSIVVAVIGGMSLAGGRRSYIGVAAAAILITVLTSLLTTMQIGEAGRQIVFGCILVVFLLVNRHLDRAH